MEVVAMWKKRTPPKKLDADGLWSYALKALQVKPYSAGEFRRKLNLKAETPAAAQATMAKLLEYGLINDNSFSENYAASRLQNQGFGRFRVLQDLRGKQVSGEVATKAVETAFTGTDEQTLIAQFLERKYRNVDLPAYLKVEKNLASAYRRLRVSGFSSTATVAVLRRFASKADEIDEQPEDD